jgi:hypothetical protein
MSEEEPAQIEPVAMVEPVVMAEPTTDLPDLGLPEFRASRPPGEVFAFRARRERKD